MTGKAGGAPFDLTGRVAIVTGGNGGIGLGMAEGLAQAGAAILVVGRNAQKNADAVTALSGAGARAAAIVADASDEKACAGMVEEAIQRFGRLDILVNNAGINIRKRPEEYTLAEWREIIDVNLTSAFICSRAVYPAMKTAGGGKIINIGSMTSIFGVPLCRTLRSEQGRHRADEPLLRGRLGGRQYPGERRAAGLDRHAADGARAARYRRPRRAGEGPHAGRALGRAAGPRWDRGVPRGPGLGFHHRHGHPGRWRVFDARLGTRT